MPKFNSRAALVMCTALVLPAVTLSGKDLQPPSWRGDPGTTFQQWEFRDGNFTSVPPDEFDNPFGVPFLDLVLASGATPPQAPPGGEFVTLEWDPFTFTQPDRLVIEVPNRFEAGKSKEVWIQITYVGQNAVPVVTVTERQGSASALLVFDRTIPAGTPPLQHELSVFDFLHCPDGERIEITPLTGIGRRQLPIDEIVIDTRCTEFLEPIPEPATAIPVAAALIALVFRRRIARRATMQVIAGAMLSPALFAGMIITPVGTEFNSPGGTARIVNESPDPPNTNNDDQPLRSNHKDIGKEFTALRPIDMVFGVTNTSGVTEYDFSEAVLNRTGFKWYDFHILLGFGTGDNFQMSRVADMLDFDLPDKNPPPGSDRLGFVPVVHTDDQLAWVGPTFVESSTGGRTGFVAFSYSIDVPDYNANIPASARRFDEQGNVVGYNFTVREIPTIPEPGTFTLILAGFGGLQAALFFRRRRHRRSNVI
jgi:hypothetical protein